MSLVVMTQTVAANPIHVAFLQCKSVIWGGKGWGNLLTFLGEGS